MHRTPFSVSGLCVAVVVAFGTVGTVAQTSKWALATGRFSDSEYWTSSDSTIGDGAQLRLLKEVDPQGGFLSVVRTSKNSPVLVKVVGFDGMDTTGITLRVNDCPGTVGLVEQFKALSKEAIFQRPNGGGTDVLFAAISAAATQHCMDFEQSRTYRVPPAPVTTNIEILDMTFSLSITVVDGTRLRMRHGS